MVYFIFPPLNQSWVQKGAFIVAALPLSIQLAKDEIQNNKKKYSAVVTEWKDKNKYKKQINKILRLTI